MYKIRVYFLMGGMIISQIFCSMPVSALEKNVEMNVDLVKEEEVDFNHLSDEQLNDMIDKLYLEDITTETKIEKNAESVKAAWRLAVQILRNNGYNCTAALMECSLNGMDYSESKFASVQRTGLFSRTLPGSVAYSDYKRKVRNGKNPKGINFDENDTKDLYYSLGHVDTKVVSRAGTYTSLITDTYDFSYQKYEKLLVSLVNNAAWLSQHMDVLKPIGVSIYTVFK